MHLDARTHEALLAGTLPPEAARALARHLESGCELCEAFLTGLGGADAIDGRVDLALAAASRRRHAGTDAEFAAIEQRLAGGRMGSLVPMDARRARPAARRGVRAMFPLAAAAAVLVAGLAALLARGPERPAWDGTKGAAATAPAVRLRFLVVGLAEDLRRGASGDAVPDTARLQFEIELARPAHVALARVGPDASVDVFWNGALGAGDALVTLDGRPAAYGLQGLGGPQRFVAIASETPLAAEEVARAASAPGGEVPPGGAIALDAVEVRVE